MKKNLILVGSDVPDNWDFKKGLEKVSGLKWEVKKSISNRFDGIHKYTRYIKYLLTPLKIVVCRKNYDNILAWQQFFGLSLVFYLRLFHIKKAPSINIMTFIYKPKKGIVGKIYKHYIKYAISSEYIDHIIVYGSSEVRFYSSLFDIPMEKFISETLGIEDKRQFYITKQHNDEDSFNNEKYYVAPGRSNRDYDFLRRVWNEEYGKLVVVSDMEKSEDTLCIKYERNCFESDYLDLLSNAYAVIVPLKDINMSSGQLVYLQSAMFGKPVITTKNNTVFDYVEDGISGFIIDKTENAFRDAINKLNDSFVYKMISCQSRKKYEEKFSLYELGCRIGGIINQD